MWKRIPRGWRVGLIAAAAVYCALIVRMFFVLPLLGFVLVGALIWVGWSLFALVAVIEQLRARRGKLLATKPIDRRSDDTRPLGR